MKTFILALVVLTLIIGALVLTGWMLRLKTNALSAAARMFPTLDADVTPLPSADFSKALNLFRNEWSSAKKAVRFLRGHKEADCIDDAFAELQYRFLLRDRAGYMCARDLLLRTIERLSDDETFTFDTIT